ncbi:hypothetical protein [Devosia sp. Leaf64]|uniref:hypothetical protein n=1 Tax=Devosia sp. Leaf64 TaxID=1736229 RepID=UPI0007144735|nr:hypothetical protein [Devosia sp. Leaf64]KQN75040.1 hypothetical protein ASE94_01595 [Devosia sp. Leaf64]
MSVLPAEIELSARAVSEMNVEGADRFSARDLSYALCVIYLALHRQPEDEEGEIYRIPDNRLRAALGLSRRSGLETEAARYVRLRDSTVRIDDGRRMQLPTTLFRLQSGRSEPVMHNLGDEVSWVIDSGLLDAFRPSAGDRVRIPVSLLAGASTRGGLELSCRLLALHALGPTNPKTKAWDDEYCTISMPYAKAERALRLPKVPPSALMDKFLKPAFQDAWNACGLTIDVEMRRSGTVSKSIGRVRDIVIFVRRPAPSPIAEKLRNIEAERGGTWQKPPRSKRERHAPADNVVAFQPPPVLRKPFGFGRRPVGTNGTEI